MGQFKQIAEPLVSRGVPVIPLRPRTKIAFLNDWDKIASIDPSKVIEWDEEYPDANGACVSFARPDGVWFLEIDKEGFVSTIEKQTGQKMPQTFMVRSSPGRGHFYFRHTPESILMGNRQGKDEHGKEAWSARADNRYVVAPGSVHPVTGLKYEILMDISIAPAPKWLVDWCVANSGTHTATGHVELDDTSPIPEGSRNDALTSILGKARQVLEMDREQLEAFGLSINQKRCNPPLPDAEVRTIANSISKYAISKASLKLKMGDKPLVPEVDISLLPTPHEVELVPYPIFPRWVMKGTSLYDGFIGPMCEANERIPEFMFMPGIVLMMNYLGGKVYIDRNKNLMPSFFLVLIGQKARTHKSSSVNDMVEYLKGAQVVNYGGPGIRNAEGRSLIFTLGSTEMLGQEMMRTNCANAVLFYDELTALVSKARIQNSSMLSHLLSISESGRFANGSSMARRQQFSFEPNTYTGSLITCTTNRNFSEKWSSLSGERSGLDDRTFFLYQPEIFPKHLIRSQVDMVTGAIETKRRIDKAIAQREYSMPDTTQLTGAIEKYGVRIEGRAEKLALYFAIDLGRDYIDDDCIERAIDICKYEIAAKNFLRVFDSRTKEGQIQLQIINTLQRYSGVMEKKAFEKLIQPLSYGTSLYSRCYTGLMQAGYLAEQGTGQHGDPIMVVLLRTEENEE